MRTYDKDQVSVVVALASDPPQYRATLIGKEGGQRVAIVIVGEACRSHGEAVESAWKSLRTWAGEGSDAAVEHRHPLATGQVLARHIEKMLGVGEGESSCVLARLIEANNEAVEERAVRRVLEAMAKAVSK